MGSAALVADEAAGLPLLRFPIFDGLPLDAVVTTRHGGVSDGPYESLNLGLHVGDDPEPVLENRRRAAAAVGLTLDDLVFCNQVHRPEVAVVAGADRGRGAHALEDAFADTDALVTADVGVGLVVMVADCVPIVLYDPAAHVLSCVHAGWGGTVARVAEAAVARMVELGAQPATMLAGIGPSIGPTRYQVGDDVRDRAVDAFGDDVDQVVRPDGTGKWLFDLWEANRLTLVDAGLQGEHIAVGELDTDGSAFFSHRATGRCGRFAAIAQLLDPR